MDIKTGLTLLFWILVLLSGPQPVVGQANDVGYEKVYKDIMEYDSILFKRGYDHCDTGQVKLLMADDFEFYHDQAGMISSGQDFLSALASLCHLNYKASRELDESSVEVHLLKNQGEIYGVLQSGRHSFFAESAELPRQMTSTATFHHLWIKTRGSWKLKRVISYNHKQP